MKMLFMIVTLFTLDLISGRPGRNDEYIKRVIKESHTHFGNFKDPKELNLPPSKTDDNNTQPYRFNSTNDGSGNYYFSFDTFGLQRYEVGELKNPGTENEIQVVRGQYIERYVNENGLHVVHTIGYIADENGYQPFLLNVAFVLSLAPAAPPGGPKGPKSGISSATLGSLIGGNIG